MWLSHREDFLSGSVRVSGHMWDVKFQGVYEASHPGMSCGSATVKILLSGSVRVSGHMWDVKLQVALS